jgi:hypothetical protein
MSPMKPYSREFFAPRPSRTTLFFRTFLLWQAVRFIWINLKMIRMIGKAHHGHMPATPALAAAGAVTPVGAPQAH